MSTYHSAQSTSVSEFAGVREFLEVDENFLKLSRSEGKKALDYKDRLKKCIEDFRKQILVMDSGRNAQSLLTMRRLQSTVGKSSIRGLLTSPKFSVARDNVSSRGRKAGKRSDSFDSNTSGFSNATSSMNGTHDNVQALSDAMKRQNFFNHISKSFEQYGQHAIAIVDSLEHPSSDRAPPPPSSSSSSSRDKGRSPVEIMSVPVRFDRLEMLLDECADGILEAASASSFRFARSEDVVVKELRTVSTGVYKKRSSSSGPRSKSNSFFTLQTAPEDFPQMRKGSSMHSACYMPK